MYHLSRHIALVAGLGFITSSPEEVDRLVIEACAKYKADPKLIHIMIDVESKKKAIRHIPDGSYGAYAGNAHDVL